MHGARHNKDAPTKPPFSSLSSVDVDMAVYRLSQSFAFPSPEHAEPNGLLAVGGDLHPERLLRAYSEGIFPYPCEGLPLTWHSPDPRMLLHPSKAKVSRSMRKIMRKKDHFEMRADTAFKEVVERCATTRNATWITPQIKAAYTQLHHLGFAHSIETWHNGELVGGLYGISLGRAFFGESMFHTQSNASKAAFLTLCKQAEQWKFLMIDCQLPTDHLFSLGAYTVDRKEFLKDLETARRYPTRLGRWRLDDDLWDAKT